MNRRKFFRAGLVSVPALTLTPLAALVTSRADPEFCASSDATSSAQPAVELGVKPLVRECVRWLEEVESHGPVGSEFEVQLPAPVLNKAKTVLHRAAHTPVTLLTGPVSPKSVVAGLVLQHAGLTHERVYGGEYTKDDVLMRLLIRALCQLVSAQLVLVKGNRFAPGLLASARSSFPLVERLFD